MKFFESLLWRWRTRGPGFEDWGSMLERWKTKDMVPVWPGSSVSGFEKDCSGFDMMWRVLSSIMGMFFKAVCVWNADFWSYLLNFIDCSCVLSTKTLITSI